MDNLEEVINEAIEDVEVVPETESPETIEQPEVKAEAETEEAPPAEKTEEVKTPEAKVDDFEKKYGVQAQSVSGRENRIPYSRVKKITEKAVADAKKEWDSAHTPKITEYDTKVKEYETKLKYFNDFEKILQEQPQQFLAMLSKVPAYEPFFRAVEEAINPKQPQQQAPVETEDFVEPDETLPDGTKVYSMEGLKALMASERAKAKREAVEEVSKRFKPMEDEWQAHQRVESLRPKVQSQIAEARQWPMFNESEDEIVEALRADRSLSLEGAWRKVVIPKLQADRTKIREEVLNEVKKAPKATSIGTTAAKATHSTEGRSLEDVIFDSIKDLK